ncbi:MAG: LysR family transcriptional regulator [Comamonas sp.]|jgi:DNA-binding transcriptional LysR family regulator|uniref:LysR family transcriptional regulator n=1 Tax=Comamonas sp. TaxID=34028 RepID=UPI0028393B73|nr:LysR family transcriptional regulator [Comamonas sp.]MDR0214715.1 LysR family transcriptional regulator [Comamonas sp.]
MISQEIGESSSQIGAQRLPSLMALRCFEAAARLESFSRAADELHLTHGAVSRAVRSVEEELGAPLFERRNRRVFLNDHGRVLFEGVHAGLAQMARAADAVRQRVARRALLLSCEPTLLMRWLIPRWGDFQALHPDITVHLVAGGGAVDWGGGMDLAIRRNDFDWGRTTYAVPLRGEQIGPVCQPQKLAQFFAQGVDERYALRPDAPLLQSKTRPHAWVDWQKNISNGSQPLAYQAQAASNLIFEHFYLSLQAASAGLGVAMGPQLLVRDELEAGRLLAPLGFVADGSQYCLLASAAWAPGSAQQKLCDWLLQRMCED